MSWKSERYLVLIPSLPVQKVTVTLFGDCHLALVDHRFGHHQQLARS